MVLFPSSEYPKAIHLSQYAKAIEYIFEEKVMLLQGGAALETSPKYGLILFSNL